MGARQAGLGGNGLAGSNQRGGLAMSGDRGLGEEDRSTGVIVPATSTGRTARRASSWRGATVVMVGVGVSPGGCRGAGLNHPGNAQAATLERMVL